ncbi:MAG: hypothetical protein GC191_01075 [Azospirillum sp.]|nr:hypothetical protein [Azospirillum sp.]
MKIFNYRAYWLRVAAVLAGVLNGLVPGGPSAAAADDAPVMLDQNWSETLRQLFYFTPQGSYLIPYAWGLALETPDGSERFFSGTNMARFGYLPHAANEHNPDGLPIGFAVDGRKGDRWLGMTCAACHTHEMAYQGRRIRIDGGAALADFQGFVEAMDKAVALTLGEGPPFKPNPRFDRFAVAALGSNHSPNQAALLRTELYNYVQQRKLWQIRNETAIRYGHARVDAFGIIFNQSQSRDLKIIDNRAAPAAPVSYPVLWDTPQHERVQWNGIARNNVRGGPLGRNVGQVLGVFGRVDITKAGDLGYCSTAKRTNLEALEKWVTTLWSPQWPEQVLPPIDRAGAGRGAAIYQQRCVGCHTLINRTDPERKAGEHMVPLSEVGTDPTMAANAAFRCAYTGVLEGAKSNVVRGAPLSGQEFAGTLLQHIAAGAIIGSFRIVTCDAESDFDSAAKGWLTAVAASVLDFFGFGERPDQVGDLIDQNQQPAQCGAKPLPTELYYKARPLDGVWASAPYLHNGSVPTLKALLGRAADRPATFYVGNPEFDPAAVGYRSDVVGGGFRFDTAVPGNGNQGHEYGAPLDDSQRQDLIEFLKTL